MSTSPSFTDDQVSPDGDYTYRVTAIYANSTESGSSKTVRVSFAQPVTLPYSIDFEPGTGGWMAGKSYNGWSYGSSEDLGISGNSGHFYGISGSETAVNNQVRDCLVSPAADLSGFIGSDLILSFDYSYLRSPKFGKFDVVYRTSPDSSWTAISRIEAMDETQWVWSKAEVVLPKEALTATTQIGFLFENHGTAFGGAGIDNISLSVLSSGSGIPDATFSLRVFPNPSLGVFQLELSGESQSAVRISILNVSGQEVLSEQIIPTGSVTLRNFDLSQEAKGTYQVRIQSDKGTWTKRITLQ
jgi:hypothetical protein